MLSFALRSVAWSLGLFGLIRLKWFETLIVVPLTRIQAGTAAALFGTPVSPVEITLACSGADTLALCAGVILAYPSAWRLRGLGASLAVLMILALNTLRIGVLGQLAGTPLWFEAFHVYVWPGLLALAIALYVLTWMRFANRRPAGRPAIVQSSEMSASPAPSSAENRRFLWASGALFILFIATSSLYLESRLVLSVAAAVAREAASALGLLGIAADAIGNVLRTPRGSFLVTQECISTPLIPLYLAAVLVYSKGWPARLIGLLLALPLFFALGVARLLVVALPAVIVASPLFVIHAFYQLLLGATLVVIAAIARRGAGLATMARALLAVALGGVFAYLLGSGYAGLLIRVTGGRTDWMDPQGALELLPAFQIGLFAALSVVVFVDLPLRSFLAGLSLLCLSQIALLGSLSLLDSIAGLTPHIRDIRAWAVAAPLLLCGALALPWARPPRPLDEIL